MSRKMNPQRIRSLSCLIIYPAVIEFSDIKKKLSALYKVENDSDWEYIFKRYKYKNVPGQIFVYVKSKLNNVSYFSSSLTFHVDGKAVEKECYADLPEKLILRHILTSTDDNVLKDDILTNMDVDYLEKFVCILDASAKKTDATLYSNSENTMVSPSLIADKGKEVTENMKPKKLTVKTRKLTAKTRKLTAKNLARLRNEIPNFLIYLQGPRSARTTSLTSGFLGHIKAKDYLREYHLTEDQKEILEWCTSVRVYDKRIANGEVVPQKFYTEIPNIFAG